MSDISAAANTAARPSLAQILSSEKYVKWICILPLLILLAVFMLYPTFYCLILSFTDYVLKGAPEFIGLENYRDLMHDRDFWQALGRTFYILVICISVELVLGMTFAHEVYKAETTRLAA